MNGVAAFSTGEGASRLNEIWGVQTIKHRFDVRMRCCTKKHQPFEEPKASGNCDHHQSVGKLDSLIEMEFIKHEGLVPLQRTERVRVIAQCKDSKEDIRVDEDNLGFVRIEDSPECFASTLTA